MGSDRPLAVAPDSTNSLGSLCPFLWGATRRESNIVTVFPKKQTEEVTRGERSNTAVNKMKKRIWGRTVQRLWRRSREWEPSNWFQLQRERIQGLLSPTPCCDQGLCQLPGCHLSPLHSSAQGTFTDADLQQAQSWLDLVLLKSLALGIAFSIWGTVCSPYPNIAGFSILMAYYFVFLCSE